MRTRMVPFQRHVQRLTRIARQAAAATLVNSGMVMIAGGVNGSGYLAGMEAYDPGAGTFALVGSLGTARGFQSATLLKSGIVLLDGGFNGNVLASAELFDLTGGGDMVSSFSASNPSGQWSYGSLTAVGINCTLGASESNCTEAYDLNAVVVLTATPASGWELDQWTGPCSTETSLSCSVTMDQARTVSVSFTTKQYTMSVVAPTGGSIKSFTSGSADGNIDCGSTCSKKYPATSTVVLKTGLGGTRIVDLLPGDQLPRIC